LLSEIDIFELKSVVRFEEIEAENEQSSKHIEFLHVILRGTKIVFLGCKRYFDGG
jgi:hypothetical protein